MVASRTPVEKEQETIRRYAGNGECARSADGDEIMRQLDCVVKRARIREKLPSGEVDWKRRSVLYDLPYWKDQLLRHNIDVMHTEKNVMDNILGTLLNMNGKTKDNLEARQDLRKMNLRPKLHPFTAENNKTYLPAACFTMTKKEKTDFLQVLHDVRVPDGYSSNVSRCVKLKECGPVHYRWMYPVERCLGRYKHTVRNKAAPEGSIAEGYIMDELLTFCSRYLDNAQTVHNKPPRHQDESKGASKRIKLDMMTFEQAHRYILFNSDDFLQLRKMHIDLLMETNNMERTSHQQLMKQHRDQFCSWYKSHVDKLDGAARMELGEKLVSHVRGPMLDAEEYKRYVVNGVLYRTVDVDKEKKSQNSGVCVTTEDGPTYYGKLTRIIEVTYYDWTVLSLTVCPPTVRDMDGFVPDGLGAKPSGISDGLSLKPSGHGRFCP
ncbi:hypothetical protein SLA2020_388620 [Shorea laevis]